MPSSSPERRRVVVAYDVADDARRARVATLLEDHGVRVQFSVFECLLRPREMQVLGARLRQVIDPSTDRVSLYALCRRCDDGVRRVGVPPADPGAGYRLL